MEDALTAMRAANGAGISGIQIGVPWRFFWMTDEKGNEELAVNPAYQTIHYVGEVPRYVREGCLSFPDVRAQVRRYSNILVKYECSDSSLSKPKEVWCELTGLKAHVFQHELEHLDGKLFIDSMFASERDKLIRQLPQRIQAGA
jgi:peptide deformylase